MLSAIKNCLDKFGLLSSQNTFIVGFSGGADSLCLLNALAELRSEYGFKLVAAHLNHNWRGKEALNEQIICRNYAKTFDVEFITETLPEKTNMSEDEARHFRYDFFKKCAENFSNVFVLTAHNANDNAETLFYRFVKGTGISGLAGIPEYIKKDGIIYVRPLLKVLRYDIENYCKNKNLVPNEDSSNESVKYKRNYIRKEIFPLLANINPNFINSVNSLSEIALQNEIIINDLLINFFDSSNNIIFDKFKNSDEALKSKIVHKFLMENDIDYSHKKIKEILNFISQKTNLNKKYSITTDKWIIFNEEKIYIVSNKKKKYFELDVLKEDVVCNLPEKGKFVIEKFKEELFTYPKENSNYAYVDFTNIDFPLKLRTRKEGDVITPFGMNGKMKLKKYLINKKISQEERDNLILLAKGNEVLWVIGVGLSNKLKVANKPTNVIKYII